MTFTARPRLAAELDRGDVATIAGAVGFTVAQLDAVVAGTLQPGADWWRLAATVLGVPAPALMEQDPVIGRLNAGRRLTDPLVGNALARTTRRAS